MQELFYIHGAKGQKGFKGYKTVQLPCELPPGQSRTPSFKRGRVYPYQSALRGFEF